MKTNKLRLAQETIDRIESFAKSAGQPLTPDREFKVAIWDIIGEINNYRKLENER